MSTGVSYKTEILLPDLRKDNLTHELDNTRHYIKQAEKQLLVLCAITPEPQKDCHGNTIDVDNYLPDKVADWLAWYKALVILERDLERAVDNIKKCKDY